MSIFNSIAGKRTRYNVFDLSHDRKMSLKMGYLIPFLNEPIVPGDKFKCQAEIMVRFAPMLAPIMHRINLYTYYFFVPNRIIWDEWEDFITGGREGNLKPDFPTVSVSDSNKAYFEEGDLADYFGIPSLESGTSGNISISALPFRAYQEIFNEYFIDPNNTSPVEYGKGSGAVPTPDYGKLLNLRNKLWEKDYLTSCLPWTQRGDGASVGMSPTGDNAIAYDSSTGNPVGAGDVQVSGNGEITVSGNNISIDPASTFDINELRQAVNLQEWLERSARGGHRYIEQILSHFGVMSKNARLDRPEFLGGGKQTVSISEVLNTAGVGDAETQTGDPGGTMYGHGISVGAQHRARRRFTEHGYLIGMMCVLPRTSYMDTLDRDWRKFDKFDFYWPEFAHLGEQEVYNHEAYFDGKQSDPNGVFGYNPRYSEYKYRNSTVHGVFRSSLKHWHMAREFDTAPSLNYTFTKADPTTRIFTVPGEDDENLYCHIYNKVKAKRPMPYFGTPTL